MKDFAELPRIVSVDHKLNFVSLAIWIKALLHVVTIHCAEKGQRASIVGKHRNTVNRMCRKSGVDWPEAKDRDAEVIPGPPWMVEMVQWMLSLRREDLPLKEPPAWMRRWCQATAPKECLHTRLDQNNTVTVNLDHYARAGRRADG